jgi:hypothetical protein
VDAAAGGIKKSTGPDRADLTGADLATIAALLRETIAADRFPSGDKCVRALRDDHPELRA